jgi:hypothetical protein
VRELHVVDRVQRLRHPCPVRADLRELSFAGS